MLHVLGRRQPGELTVRHDEPTGGRPRTFTVRTADAEDFTFDSLECAAHRLAPTCAHCGCRVLGHGVEVDATVFCCANCAQLAGADGVRDSV